LERLVQANREAGVTLITASAPGKINLYFAVGPKLSNGYHEVCSVYLALNLREEVSVAKSAELKIEVSGNINNLDSVPKDETNLVVKAARLVTDEIVAFQIKKHVPIAGGMGGGSADAAAALLAASELFGTELPSNSVTLGADVPFALMGGVALGTGVGENLTSLPMHGELHVVLIPSEGQLSTPVVYNHLDELRENADLIPETAPTTPTELLEALKRGHVDEIAKLAHNDLQWAALSLKPELQDTIDRAKAAGALTAMVSGSGPTVFAIAADLDSANKIAAEFGGTAIVTTGPSAGAKIEA
jgi:4-diphosphocytidyl-2-C-methyl-D-erythritol kinase